MRSQVKLDLIAQTISTRYVPSQHVTKKLAVPRNFGLVTSSISLDIFHRYVNRNLVPTTLPVRGLAMAYSGPKVAHSHAVKRSLVDVVGYNYRHLEKSSLSQFVNLSEAKFGLAKLQQRNI